MNNTPAVAFNNTKAVFIGRMIGGTETINVKDASGKPLRFEAGKVSFSVDEVFKGDLKKTVTIEIASMTGTSCGPYGLMRGQQYVVYAYGDKDDENKLYSGVCTRTRPVNADYAKEDLDFLRNLPPAGTGGNLQGSIWIDSKATSGGGAVALPNVKIAIRDENNKEIFVTSDKDGKFEATKIKAGKYTVIPQLPKDYHLEEGSTEVEVADRGTATIGFEAYFNGSASGQVIDKNGREFNSIFLNFLSSKKDKNQKLVDGQSTGRDGKFEIEGIPPGEYILFIELQNDDYKNDRNYYYPGTFNRNEAQIFRIGLNEKVDKIKFSLPDEYEVKTIEGQVFWEDGKPAVGAEIKLLCPKGLASNKLRIEFSPTTAQTDKDGKFKLEAFAGETYWLMASGSKDTGKKDEEIIKYSRSEKIQTTENIKDKKIILSKDEASNGCH